MASKRPANKKETTASPLDEKRRALLEHERKINEEIERRNRLIADAPKIKQEQAKRRRDEILNRKSRVETGSNTRAALHDKRHVFDANAATIRPGPRLKREQRRGMLTFFVLLIVFACAIAWILTLFRPS